MRKFQSTHPRGVRLSLANRVWRVGVFQSTHPRGVRLENLGKSPYSGTGFNPRTRVGCDIVGPISISSHSRFQSTHPRGVRHEGELWKYIFYYGRFNPRTRVGCDVMTAPI